MAESRGSLLAKSVQKYSGRAKEKLLQNLGKVDRTADEIFDEHLTNFTKQNASATKLQKEFNNYIRCVRAAQLASKSLMDAVAEVYEPHWCGYDELISQIQTSEAIWQDFSHKLGDQVLIPLNTYTAQFPDMKKKIEKRNRKLIDYDSQRHSFQNLQANASKRKDDIKLTKGREQLEEARRTYEILNTELHDELPALYDSRILFLVTNLQTLFASEQIFHNEVSKIFAELESIVDKLATESQRGSYTLKKSNINISKEQSHPELPIKMNHTMENSYQNQSQIHLTNGTANKPSSPVSSSSSPSSNNDQDLPETPKMSREESNEIDKKSVVDNASSNIETNGVAQTDDEDKEENRVEQKKENNNIHTAPPQTVPKNEKRETNPFEEDEVKENEAKAEVKKNLEEKMNGNGIALENGIVKTTDEKKNEEMKSDAKNNNGEDIISSSNDLPPGVLYRVKATYSYEKEDVDELSFEVGDIIQVIEYDDPEDQEEGWLMGRKECSNDKGMFPANFTRPI